MNFRNPSPFLQNLFSMPYKAQYPKVILAALNNDIFSGLKTKKTAEQLAEEKQLHKENTKFLLDALFSMGYIDKVDGFYKNKYETDKHLVKGEEEYIGGYLQFFGTNMESTFPNDITELVSKGPTYNNKAEQDSAMTDFSEFINKMRECQDGYRKNEFMAILKDIPEFNNTKSMLDLGCGTGMFSLEVAKQRPDINVTLFDLPAMKEAIEQSITMTSTENNTRVIVGDFLKDNFEEKYDMIISVCSMGFVKNDLDIMLEKIYNSLNGGGVYVNLQEGINSDFSGPTDQVIGCLVVE